MKKQEINCLANSEPCNRAYDGDSRGAMTTDYSDFSKMLAAAQAGSEPARAHLYCRFAPQIERRIRRRARNGLRRTHDTVDLTQSVFVEVLRDLPRFEDRGERAFRAWLNLKSDNKVRSRYRRALDRNGLRREIGLGAPDVHRPDPASGPRTGVHDLENRQRLSAARARLRPEDRMVLHLRQDACDSYAEIAAFMGLPSADAARKRHVRALLALRAAWDGLDGGSSKTVD